MESNPPKPKTSVSKKEPVLDEWEAKLLGKKGAVPYKSPESSRQDQGDNVSQFSVERQPSVSGFTPLPEPVPRNSLSAMQQPQVQKHKRGSISKQGPSSVIKLTTSDPLS